MKGVETINTRGLKNRHKVSKLYPIKNAVCLKRGSLKCRYCSMKILTIQRIDEIKRICISAYELMYVFPLNWLIFQEGHGFAARGERPPQAGDCNSVALTVTGNLLTCTDKLSTTMVKRSNMVR
jgi:hypothetical protein